MPTHEADSLRKAFSAERPFRDLAIAANAAEPPA